MMRWSCLFVLLAGCAMGGADDPNDPELVNPVAVPALEGEDAGAINLTEIDAAVDTTPPPDTSPPPPPPPPDTSTKKVLTFAWQGQQTGYWCGPGSTRIALSARMPSPPSQTTLASFLGTTTSGTDHIGLVANALNKYLGTTKYRAKDMYDPPTAAQRAALKADILALIGDGWPMVANVISGWRPPGYPSGTIYHYVSVMGYDEGGEKVLIGDPAGDGAAGSGWTKVPRSYWISLNDLGTWIGGKGYTGR